MRIAPGAKNLAISSFQFSNRETGATIKNGSMLGFSSMAAAMKVKS